MRFSLIKASFCIRRIGLSSRGFEQIVLIAYDYKRVLQEDIPVGNNYLKLFPCYF